MKYYLVGILDKESYIKIEEFQKKLGDKYDLFDSLPMLHMTLEVIESNNIESVFSLIEEYMVGQKKLVLDSIGFNCFDPPFKSVNVHVKKTDSIMSLIKGLNSFLKSNKISVRENIDDWDLHISLANVYFSKRSWSQGEYQSACSLMNSYKFEDKLIIDSVELWKPVNNKEEMVLKSFKLI